MPASSANPGFGIKFKVGNGASPEVFTEEAEVRGVPGVGYSHAMAEVTNMSSPSGWAEYIATQVKESKEFTLPLNFVADSVSQLALYQTKAAAGTKTNYQLLFTDDGASTLTFAAFISDVNIDHELRDAAMLNLTFRPTGVYTWA